MRVFLFANLLKQLFFLFEGVQTMPITDILEKNAKLYGEEDSLIEINPQHKDIDSKSWKEMSLVETGPENGYRKVLTWKEFDERANQVANLLINDGVKRGDKIGILMMNCLEWLPIYFGVLKTGALAVPYNFRYSSDEIKYCLSLSDVSILLFGPEFIERMDAIKDDIEKVKKLYFVGDNCPTFAQSYDTVIDSFSKENPCIELKDEDDGAIYFSSGTTGFPKAILHSHASLVSACVTEQAHHGQTRDDVFLCIPPLYHTGAKMHWFGSLLAGSKGVLLRGIDPEWIIDTAMRERATVVWLLVPWAQDILDAIESGKIDLSKYDLSPWRLMHIGAQPVPPSLVKRWKKYFPNHEYDTNYGLSESIGPGAVHLGVENIHKVGAIGKAGFGWKTKIVNEQGEEVERGSVGELVIHGPGIMKCYYKDNEATEAVLKDGWLLTGDMAKEDEDGFIYLVDRKKDVIISGGENIYPVQIEDFLRKFNKIKDVGVIGVLDQRLGEIVAAVIQIKPDITCTEEEVRAFCEDLPRYKRPKQIIFADVPRNPTGKIEKPKLREQYAGGSIVDKQVEINM